MTEPKGGGPALSGVIALLVSQYRYLADTCYRVSVTQHDDRGRFRRRHQARTPHPVLLKKIDLDRDLARVYRKFFGPPAASVEPRPTSISNNRPQGSEKRTDSASPSRFGPTKER